MQWWGFKEILSTALADCRLKMVLCIFDSDASQSFVSPLISGVPRAIAATVDERDAGCQRGKLWAPLIHPRLLLRFLHCISLHIAFMAPRCVPVFLMSTN